MTNCPHCHAPIESAPHLAGQLVECPHCRGQFVMPGGMTVQAVQPAPNIVITHQHALAPQRGKQQGRSVEVRAMLIAAGATLIIGLGVFGVWVARIEYAKHTVKQAFKEVADEISRPDEEGRPYVAHCLKSAGFVLANNAVISKYGDGYKFSGMAKDSKGQLRRVSGLARVAIFNAQSDVELVEFVVDGERVIGN